MQYTFTLLFSICFTLQLTGCATAPSVDREITNILDQCKDPQGRTDRELLDLRNKAVNDEFILLSPLISVSFESYDKVRDLVEKYGLEPVYAALYNEVENSPAPRANRALSLLASIDETDEWMNAWLNRGRE